MRNRRAIAFAVLAGSALAVGCAWSRFDDLKDNVPVVEIKNPGGMPGFGATMATVPTQSSTRLLVMGEPNQAPKGATWEINDDDPSSSPSASGFCDDGRCLFGGSPAPLRSLTIGGVTHPACFVLGVGDRNNVRGLVGNCADGEDFVLPVPGEDPRFPDTPVPVDIITEDLTNAELNNRVIADFEYAASSDEPPLIAAASQSLGAFWYYPPGSTEPTVVTPVFPQDDDPDPQPPTDPRLAYGDTFGGKVAVATVGQGGHLIAVASPRGVADDILGRVWLYRVIDGKIVHDGPQPDVPKPVGCLPGFKDNFGTYMHTGRLFGGASDELLISDGATIHIYDAGALADNPPTESCGGAPFANSGFLTGVTCVETSSVTGCSYATSGFGRSLAIADVNGDGKNELIVGAPTLEVEGTQDAGAVLVYEVDPTGAQTRLIEARILSSRDTGDALGSSVAGLRIGNRDVVAAGASGVGSFFLFYCSTTGGAGKDSSRCR